MGTLLPLLLAAHFIGDCVVQTDWQAANKVRPDGWRHATSPLYDDQMISDNRPVAQVTLLHRYYRSWRAMGAHMLGYHLCIALAIIAAHHPIAGEQHYADFLGIFGLSLVTHAFIDRRWTVKWLMCHTGSASFAETGWGVLAVDQALHLSILCLLAAVFA